MGVPIMRQTEGRMCLPSFGLAVAEEKQGWKGEASEEVWVKSVSR